MNPSNNLLRDKVAVITGAARGIGLACAKRFVAEGATVVLSDVNDDAGAAAVAELGDAAHYKRCDVTDEADIAALFDYAAAECGRIDCAIANAGIVHNIDPLELDVADFDRVIAVNLRGVFLTGQLAARRMLKQTPDANGNRGSIINMSSLNAVLTIPNIAPYTMAKGGVKQWTQALGIRLAAEGVRVNAIGPGSINTEMFQSIADDAEKMRAVMSRTPMLRAGEPDEVAKVAVFLASDYASYMAGETVYVDGGRMGLNYTVAVPADA